MNQTEPAPLYVDLDGTLIRSDVLIESMFALLRTNPLLIFLFPVWLFQGRAYFKREIARRVDLDASLLPFAQDLLDFLDVQHNQGRRLVLITASDQKYADAVAEHTGIFDLAIGSDGITNFSGIRKLDRILTDSGQNGFDYAGNATADLEIWPRAREAIVVSPFQRIIEKAKKHSNVTHVFNAEPITIQLVAKLLRTHQWSKNLLLFVPLVFAHRVGELQLLAQALAGFVSFGLCASSVYVVNDLLDLDHDRNHQTKRNRPLAAGTFPIDIAVTLAALLLVGSVVIALFLPAQFLGLLVVYYVITLAYSLRLKQVVLLDILVLAALYTIRLLAGGAATGVPVSHWLLVFSLFFFLSLGMIKRYAEVRALDVNASGDVAGRGYRADDIGLLTQFGIASGYLSVLVLALYVNSDQVRILYDYPGVIWLLCPVILYWISRVWLLAYRGQMHEDPVLFAIKDRISHWLIVLALFILWVAS
ncbi:MAG: UbiA family prenyltransferase [Arenicellales bacterium]|nr:UbiA family prenyltransferase [Arenicellales bacterium]